MDEVARYNAERWQALVDADAVFTRPLATNDVAAARHRIDSEGRLGDVAGKRVLCLAGGGGQQSVAFALLGADVTVFDLSPAQLARDRDAASALGVEVRLVEGDMRDLGVLGADDFDIVHQGYSIGFVPDAGEVFRQVARVLKNGGAYHFMCANPLVLGVSERDWNGRGYPLTHPYVAGETVTYADQDWVYDRQRSGRAVPPPREFRHTLAQLVNGLVANGFSVTHLSDVVDAADPDARPGTWSHFISVAPPWLSFWTSYRRSR